MIVSHSHLGCAMDNPGVLVVFLRPESKEIVKTGPFVHLRAVPYKPAPPKGWVRSTVARAWGRNLAAPLFPRVL